jgi:hypothetical protein
VPAYIAKLSYQLMSTPSKLFASTKSASLFAVRIGSEPAVVGNYVDPKAEIRSFFPASLKAFLNFF